MPKRKRKRGAADDNDSGPTESRTTLYEGHRGTRMSRRQWRFDTGAELATKASNRRNAAIAPVLEALSGGSLRSASIYSLCARLRDVWIPHWDTLWQHYGTRWWGHQRFGQAKKEQRVLDKIANTVLGPQHDRVAVFGDGVFPPSMKGVPPAPVTKVRNFLARKGRVVLVDEYRTSKVCHRCHNEMMQHPHVHATKHCQSESCSWSWNRDANAARNIAHLFECHLAGRARPAAFARTAKRDTVTGEEHENVRPGMGLFNGPLPSPMDA